MLTHSKMANLWRISVKTQVNRAVPGKALVKGTFIEMTSVNGTNPLMFSANRESIASAFNAKYSTNYAAADINPSFFTSEKV